MAGLEGTVNTPFGAVQKKTALYVGSVVVVLGIIVVYRHKQNAGSTTTNPADANIDPATGYPYGSAEDEAALAQQGVTGSATVSPSAGGGSNIPSGATGFTSNGEWSQAVIEYMLSNDLVQDGSQLSAALGKFLTGQYVAPGSNEDSLIHQAIAVKGYPPVSGPNGMPPAINRNPPQSTGGTGGTNPPANSDPTLPAPGHLHATRVDQGGAAMDWDPVNGAIGYRISVGGQQWGNSVVYSNAYVNLPKRKTRYWIEVQAINAKNRPGHHAGIAVTTK